jgi:integrase
MSVKVRKFRTGGWEVDLNVLLPSGERFRERRKFSGTSKSAAQRWGEERERHVLIFGPPQPEKELPTFKEFADRFMTDHVRANGLKPGGVKHKETLLRCHLIPAFGDRPLDSITNADVQRLKDNLRQQKPKSINNTLTVLNTMLKKAVEWDVIERMPCTVRLLKAHSGSIDFFEFGEFDQLIAAAEQCDWQTHLIVLLGGQAGLRSGEMRALRRSDVNFATGKIRVERNEWRGQITTTKSGRIRYVPMTTELASALHRYRHVRGELVLYRHGGQPLTEASVRAATDRAARVAELRRKGPHMLRHTFCSHLAMKGVPVRAIQELAGHQSITTTMRYMHLSPSALDSAIKMLERAKGPTRGDILETDVQHA